MDSRSLFIRMKLFQILCSPADSPRACCWFGSWLDILVTPVSRGVVAEQPFKSLASWVLVVPANVNRSRASTALCSCAEVTLVLASRGAADEFGEYRISWLCSDDASSRRVPVLWSRMALQCSSAESCKPATLPMRRHGCSWARAPVSPAWVNVISE